MLGIVPPNGVGPAGDGLHQHAAIHAGNDATATPTPAVPKPGMKIKRKPVRSSISKAEELAPPTPPTPPISPISPISPVSPVSPISPQPEPSSLPATSRDTSPRPAIVDERPFLAPAPLKFDPQDPDNQKWEHIDRFPVVYGNDPDFNYVGDNANRRFIWQQTNARIDQRNHNIDVRRELAEGSRLMNVDLKGFAQGIAQAPHTPEMEDIDLDDTMYDVCLTKIREAYYSVRGKPHVIYDAVRDRVDVINDMLEHVGIRAEFRLVMAPGWPPTPELSLHPTNFLPKAVPITQPMPAGPRLETDARNAKIPPSVMGHIQTQEQLDRIESYAARLPINMTHVFREAGLMSLLKTMPELGASIDEVTALDYVDKNALKDVILWLGSFQKEPTALFNGTVTTHHKFALHMLTVKWEGDVAETHAQRVGLAPPPGHPINQSAFNLTSIPFDYDADRYQKEWMYRYMIGERALGMTQKTDVQSWEAEVNHRMNVESTWINADGAHIRKGEPKTSGWSLNPATCGPELFDRRIHAVPRLPELHTGTFGEAVWDGDMLFYTSRAPHSRNWGTLEELTRFPLFLALVDPADFAQSPESPELLFTDRFGVTMKGVQQTPQCPDFGGHEILSRSIASTLGYEHEWASHGITYTDYRRLIVGILAILSRYGEELNNVGVRELAHFLYAASEHLRARGVPVSVKYKGSFYRRDVKFLWGKQNWVVRHQPLHIPLKFSKLTGYKRAYPNRRL